MGNRSTATRHPAARHGQGFLTKPRDPEHRQGALTARRDPARIIRTPGEVFAAAAAIPRTVPAWAGEEGPRWRITISPGSVQVGSRDYGRINRSAERRLAAAMRQTSEMTLELDRPAKRGTIDEFSQKSRARMVRRLSTLDYSPLFSDDTVPGLVTLTLPHDWEAVAPTAEAFKSIVNRFRMAYRYGWGDIIRGVWKMESQYRQACARNGCHDPRAPHLHILTAIPQGVDLRKGRAFPEWLSHAWAQAVRASKVADEGRAHVADAATPCSCSEYCRGLAAGTGVDYEETLRYADAKRIAVYFTKHGAFANKDYQNALPDAWRAAEEGGARFWGYWGIRPAEGVQETDEATAIKVARHLRKLQESQSYARKQKVWRSRAASSDLDAELVAAEDVNVHYRGSAARKVIVTDAGEVRELYQRTVTRRVRYMRGHRGFLSVNDGVATATDIARLVAYFNDLEGGGLLGPDPAMVPRSGRDVHRLRPQ